MSASPQPSDWRSAVARLVEAIRHAPGNPAYHCELGDTLLAQGNAAAAELCYREALRLVPGHLPALVNLGNALQSQRRFRDASVTYWHAIRRYPECAEAYNNLGNALRAEGRLQDAADCYRESLRQRPGNTDAAINLAGALVELGRPSEGEECARRALAQRPESAAALSHLSAALTAQRRFEEAETFARDALARAPGAAHLFANLGSVLLHRRRFAEAVQAFRGALAAGGECHQTRHALALALKGQGRLDEAAAECGAWGPHDVDGWTTLGTIRQAQGRHAEALAALDEALGIRPDHAGARFARSVSLLALGRLEEGFAEYEWRWRMVDGVPRACTRPAWDGSPLNGRTILLSAEQGLGDTIQFARYAPLVAARGGRVVMEAPERLVPLLRTVEGLAAVVTRAMPLPDFDEQAPLLSLPRILGTTGARIPAVIPYLSADPGLARRLRDRLGPAKKMRVGVAWAGNPENPADVSRSVALEVLAPLRGVRGVEWYSLQVEEPALEAVRAGGWVREVLSEQGGVAELAALMESLDLVISVDTMAAHLAGALGRQVWVLVSAAADWRWQTEREDSPWYPGMRLFRQSRLGDWSEVVRRTGEALLARSLQYSAAWTDKHS